MVCIPQANHEPDVAVMVISDACLMLYTLELLLGCWGRCAQQGLKFPTSEMLQNITPIGTMLPIVLILGTLGSKSNYHFGVFLNLWCGGGGGTMRHPRT